MAAKDDVSRRLIAAILQFLDSENLREDLDDEIKQSVDVSRQCLQSAYTITSADVPANQKTLKELFLEACPAPVSIIKFTKNMLCCIPYPIILSWSDGFEVT